MTPRLHGATANFPYLAFSVVLYLRPRDLDKYATMGSLADDAHGTKMAFRVPGIRIRGSCGETEWCAAEDFRKGCPVPCGNSTHTFTSRHYEYSSRKSKVGLITAKAAALRVKMNTASLMYLV